jgi:AcrR family transcriptional regulator
MRSIDPADATTRSRIRDASVELFGRDGYANTSVRAIAQHAGVSAALIIHHFGSKEGLRQECDQQVVAEIFGRGTDLSANQNSDALAATMQRWLADINTYRVTLDYLVRMLTEDSEIGDRLFDILVDRTEKMITEEVAAGRMNAGSDAKMTAVLIASQSLVPLILERHLGRVLGSEGLSEQAVKRMTVPTLELYTHGLYTDDTMLNAARAAFDTDGTADVNATAEEQGEQ